MDLKPSLSIDGKTLLPFGFTPAPLRPIVGLNTMQFSVDRSIRNVTVRRTTSQNSVKSCRTWRLPNSRTRGWSATRSGNHYHHKPIDFPRDLDRIKLGFSSTRTRYSSAHWFLNVTRFCKWFSYRQRDRHPHMQDIKHTSWRIISYAAFTKLHAYVVTLAYILTVHIHMHAIMYAYCGLFVEKVVTGNRCSGSHSSLRYFAWDHSVSKCLG